MKFPRRKLVPLLAVSFLMSVSCLSLLPTTTAPFPAYEGQARPPTQKANFFFKGTMAYGTLLYAIDGKPRDHHMENENRLLESSYSNTLACGFNVDVLPGEHSFEFYTVDTNPLLIYTLTFALEAGKTYEFVGSSKSFDIVEGGKKVAFAQADVPSLVEPAESEPHATFEIRREKGAMDVNVYIFRIDGKVRTPMYKRHPRWVVMNYSGLASGIVNSIGGTGMLIQANVEANEGALSVRLPPGRHHIEYAVENIFLGQRILGEAVRSLDFDFEAGKTYKPEILKDSVKIEDIYENFMKIVPE